MKKICISKGWKFTSPDIDGEKIIDLPHDYSVTLPRDSEALGGAANGFFCGTAGSYSKYLVLGDS